MIAKKVLGFTGKTLVFLDLLLEKLNFYMYQNVFAQILYYALPGFNVYS